MQVICNTEDFQITEKTAVTLGKFDGIHKGHQLLLNALLEKKKQGLKTVVFTFFVPPIPGREDVRQLTPNDEKKKFLEAYGIDYLIEYPFTERFAILHQKILSGKFYVKSFAQHLSQQDQIFVLAMSEKEM